jgi:hypothetical protein
MILFQKKSKLPAWRIIYNKPAIRYRILHIDLKGPKIPFEVFKKFLYTLARWGINGILVEYEHRLPQLPLSAQFSKEDRYTLEEIKELTELAKSLDIEWIPLIQTFGHVEYLSHLKGTENFFENPEFPNQLCPLRDEVKNYLKRLISYICEIHPYSTKINVGQDETHWLGYCSLCQKRMNKLGGKIELYLEHVQWVCSEVLNRGRIPMLWGDMLLGEGRLDLLQKIDKRVVIIPWEYGSTKKQMKYTIYKGFRAAKQQFRHPYNTEFPANPIVPFSKPGDFVEDLHTEDIEKIGGFDPDTGYPLNFAQLRVMKNSDKPLWGACAIQMSGDGPFRAHLVRGFMNSNEMCKFLIENQGEGIIATSWARGHSFAPINAPWTLSLYCIVQWAVSAWTGKTNPEDLRERASEIALELDMPKMIGEWSLDDIFWTISGNMASSGPYGKLLSLTHILELLKNAQVSGLFGKGLIMSIEAEILQAKLQFIIEEGRWWFPTKDYGLKIIPLEMEKRFKEIQSNMKSLKPEWRRYFLKWIGEQSAFDLWWNGIFGMDFECAKKSITLLKKHL